MYSSPWFFFFEWFFFRDIRLSCHLVTLPWLFFHFALYLHSLITLIRWNAFRTVRFLIFIQTTHVNLKFGIDWEAIKNGENLFNSDVSFRNFNLIFCFGLNGKLFSIKFEKKLLAEEVDLFCLSVVNTWLSLNRFPVHESSEPLQV